MHHSYKCDASAEAAGFWILCSKEQRVRHTVTEDHCKERGKSDVYHERGEKEWILVEKR